MSNGQGSSAPTSRFRRLLSHWKKQGTEQATFITSFSNISLIVLNLILMVIILGDYLQQKVSADRVWRAQLISTIYDKECWTTSSDERICQEKAHVRSREDAVKAYVSMAGFMAGARLRNAVLDEMAFESFELSKVDLSEASLQSTNLTSSKLKKATLVSADFRGAILRRAKLHYADLTGANLQGVNLFKAKLRGAILERATLGVCDKPKVDAATGEQYIGALPRSANCRGADFRGADFRDASLCGVDLTEAIGLSQEQLNSAHGDESTKLPKYLKMPKNWLKKQRELAGSPRKKRSRTLVQPTKRESVV